MSNTEIDKSTAAPVVASSTNDAGPDRSRRRLLQGACLGLCGLATAGASRLLWSGATAPSNTVGSDSLSQISEGLESPKSHRLAYADDVLLSAQDLLLATALHARLLALRDQLGHGQFNLLSFDQARRQAAQYHRIGSFTAAETAFLEELFYRDAAELGFRSERVVAQLSHSVKSTQLVKVGEMGNFLYDGAPQALFQRIQRDVGNSLLLTSGIRGVVKQTHIYLDKVVACGGNLSMASRSIAPPAYSYHAIGDFDVGQAGLGQGNFTRIFLDSEVCHRLRDLSYVENRYAENNDLGVRYEPWHVKVA